MSAGHKTYLQPQDVDLLERQASSLRDRLLIRVLFRTGCRISEALGLTLGDVDFEEGTLTIQHLKARINLICPRCEARLARSPTFCPRCGAQVEKASARQQEQRRLRTLPLDGDTLDMLKEYVDRGGPVGKDGKLLLFGINRHRAWQIVKECAERANVGQLVSPKTGKARHVSPHRLRDAFAVMAARRDDSTDGIRMLQEQLGHASIATTMRYRKIAGRELWEWYDGLWKERDELDSTAPEAI